MSEQPSVHLPKPGDRLGRYVLKCVLGEGGMGTVFAADDETLDREVALKVLHARGLSYERLFKGLRREARALAAVDHPNIVRVIEAGVADGGLPFLVMEMVHGKTLRVLSEHLGPIDLISAISFALQTGRALAAAHKKGIVHCDLKPDNVLVTTEARVKVGDFGLARHIERGLVGTTDQMIEGCGTPHYMAPELFRGEPPSAASDVYALGATFVELLTGKHMFSRDSHDLPSRVEVRRMHLEMVPESIEHTCGPLVVPLSRLIQATLAKEPRERPTAKEVVEGLRFEHLRLREHFPEESERAAMDSEDEEPVGSSMRAMRRRGEGGSVSSRVRAFVTEPLSPRFVPGNPLPDGFVPRSSHVSETLPSPGTGADAMTRPAASMRRQQVTEPLGAPVASKRRQDVTAPLVPHHHAGAGEKPRRAPVSSDAVTLPLMNRPAARASLPLPASSGRRVGPAVLVAIGFACLSAGLLGRDFIRQRARVESPLAPAEPPASSTAALASAAPAPVASAEVSADVAPAPASSLTGAAVVTATPSAPAVEPAPQATMGAPRPKPAGPARKDRDLRKAPAVPSVVDPWAQPRREPAASASAMGTAAPAPRPKSILPFGTSGE